MVILRRFSEEGNNSSPLLSSLRRSKSAKEAFTPWEVKYARADNKNQSSSPTAQAAKTGLKVGAIVAGSSAALNTAVFNKGRFTPGVMKSAAADGLISGAIAGGYKYYKARKNRRDANLPSPSPSQSY